MTALRALALRGEKMEGRGWYRRAGAEIRRYCESSWDLIPPGQLADALSLCSPRVQVRRSVDLALSFVATGEPPPGCLPSVARSLDVYRETGVIRGPKTAAFARALRGDLDAVVIDAWMWRAYGMKPGGRPAYRRAEALTRTLASELGWPPAETQAAVWTALRADYGYAPAELVLP